LMVACLGFITLNILARQGAMHNASNYQQLVRSIDPLSLEER
jgi:hypothetical protein